MTQHPTRAQLQHMWDNPGMYDETFIVGLNLRDNRGETISRVLNLLAR